MRSQIVQFRATPELREWLEAKAKEEGRTLSDVVRRLLEKAKEERV